jgi:hypothetical protein
MKLRSVAIARHTLHQRPDRSVAGPLYLYAYTLDTIPPPLLLPKQLAHNGLSEAHVQVIEPALLSIATI